MFRFRCCPFGFLALLASLILLPSQIAAQDDSSTPDLQIPQIADEPKTVDPSNLMPPELVAVATHDFSNSSLREFVEWLENDQGLVVLVDESSLADYGVFPAEPFDDRLDNAPIYLLLQRLRSMEVRWYFENEILYLTSPSSAEYRAAMETYNVGDLLDEGYELERLHRTIINSIAVDSWANVGGPAVLNALGDVLLVRQSDENQRNIQGLLTALRGHGRQTYVNDPTQHITLREKLEENVSVEFFDTPLVDAVASLSEMTGADIRLDIPALREIRIREREPVTLELTDRKLKTILQAIAMDLQLTWILRDGVLLVTSEQESESFLKTAVYDVRDLCRDENESDALMEAIRAQTEPDSWENVGGFGQIEFAKAGTLVITHQERVHREILDLLEIYRTALRNSKPRDRVENDPNEIITLYYRTYTTVAQDLAKLLPVLVEPESWQSEDHPEARGEIMIVASSPEFSAEEFGLSLEGGAERESASLVIARSVLIIQQTRENHQAIDDVIARVKFGDHTGTGFGGSGGFGGGGFGGGLFGVPETKMLRHPLRD